MFVEPKELKSEYFQLNENMKKKDNYTIISALIFPFIVVAYWYVQEVV